MGVSASTRDITSASAREHSFLSKKTIHRSLPPIKILGQKPKATSKVTLLSHQLSQSNAEEVLLIALSIM